MAAEIRPGAGFGIESKVGLSLSGVGSVAVEAVVRKDGADIAIEINRGRRRLNGGRLASDGCAKENPDWNELTWVQPRQSRSATAEESAEIFIGSQASARFLYDRMIKD